MLIPFQTFMQALAWMETNASGDCCFLWLDPYGELYKWVWKTKREKVQ